MKINLEMIRNQKGFKLNCQRSFLKRKNKFEVGKRVKRGRQSRDKLKSRNREKLRKKKIYKRKRNRKKLRQKKIQKRNRNNLKKKNRSP